MKKLFGISLVAMLAVSPMMASAAVGDVVATGTTPAHADSAVVSTAEPGFALATEAATDGNAASAGYVKGAYNAAIKAVNKVNAKVDGKQDTISDLATIRSGAAAGATAVQSDDLATVATTGAASDLTQDATHRFVSDTEKTTWNSKQNALSAAQLQAITDVAGKQNALNENQMAAVNSGITATDKAAYDAYATSKQNTITEQNKLSAGLVSGLANVATSGNASDLTEDATHRLVTDTEKATWSGKQDAISDLATIRSGAAAGASALQASALNDYAKKVGVTETIKDVTLSQGTVTQGLTGSVSGTSGTIVEIMTKWGDDTTKVAKTGLTAVSNGTLATNVSVAAPTINAASVVYTEQ